MKIVINSIIPKKGYKAITIWPFVFARQTLTEKDTNHEAIHLRQQAEMLILPFFLWYALEWVVRLIIYCDKREAYRNISFEQEAYMNEKDNGYLGNRGLFAWMKFLNRKTYYSIKK